MLYSKWHKDPHERIHSFSYLFFLPLIWTADILHAITRQYCQMCPAFRKKTHFSSNQNEIHDSIYLKKNIHIRAGMKYGAIKLALHSQSPFGAIMNDSNLGLKTMFLWLWIGINFPLKKQMMHSSKFKDTETMSKITQYRQNTPECHLSGEFTNDLKSSQSNSKQVVTRDQEK